MSALFPQAHAAAFDELDFATYRPGEILKRCIEAPTKVVLPPEQDDDSDCSTADTHNPCAEDAAAGSAMSSDSELTQQCPETADVALPSIGSVGHSYGLCRPCGFVHHKGGCTAGADCSFCHLCPPGTIEKQRKMKRQLVRSQRQQPSHKADLKCIKLVDVDALARPANRAASVSLMAAAAAKAAAGLQGDFEA